MRPHPWWRLAITVALGVQLSAAAGSTTITVDQQKTFQVFKGWEAEILQTVQDYKSILPALSTLFEQAANDLGITRIRLTVTAGLEHPPGYAQQYIDGVINERTLIRQYAYDIVNDNKDPKVANLEGFEFGLLDWRMDHMVVPFKRLLEARDERLYLYLSYTDFGASQFEHRDHPEEYAEFMQVIFDHLKAKYGFTPDGIDAMNEPDQTPWTSRDIGRAVAATGPRLKAAGYTPDFIVASTVDRARAVPFFEEVRGVRGARPFLTDLSYHCYHDTGPNSWPRIGRASVKYNVGTVMNECWNGGNDVAALLRHLKLAGNTSWQEGPFNGTDGYYRASRNTQQVSLNDKTRLLRQYIKYIRPGATRIEATSDDARYDPVSFVNASGLVVTVVRAMAAGAVTVKGLPAGSYDISYTTPRDHDVHLPRTTLAPNRSLDVEMPAAGVVTVAGVAP